MITTRFGSEVEVLEPADDDGWVKVKRLPQGDEREWHASELRADSPEEFNKVVCGNE